MSLQRYATRAKKPLAKSFLLEGRNFTWICAFPFATATSATMRSSCCSTPRCKTRQLMAKQSTTIAVSSKEQNTLPTKPYSPYLSFTSAANTCWRSFTHHDSTSCSLKRNWVVLNWLVRANNWLNRALSSVLGWRMAISTCKDFRKSSKLLWRLLSNRLAAFCWYSWVLCWSSLVTTFRVKASSTQQCWSERVSSSSFPRFPGTWITKTSGRLRETSSTSKELSSRNTNESKLIFNFSESLWRLSAFDPRWISHATICSSFKAHGRSINTCRTSSGDAFLEAKQINRPACGGCATWGTTIGPLQTEWNLWIQLQCGNASLLCGKPLILTYHGVSWNIWNILDCPSHPSHHTSKSWLMNCQYLQNFCSFRLCTHHFSQPHKYKVWRWILDGATGLCEQPQTGS